MEMLLEDLQQNHLKSMVKLSGKKMRKLFYSV